MRGITAGYMAEGCSNFYCWVGGEQTWMGATCLGDTLKGVTDACLINEGAGYGTCGGCAQFPEME